MPSVSIYYGLGRGLWFVGSLLFVIAGIFQVIYFIKNARDPRRVRLFLPFLLFGYAFILVGIATYLIAMHSGFFVPFATVSSLIYLLFGISGLLIGFSGLLILGRWIKPFGILFIVLVVVYITPTLFIRGLNLPPLLLSGLNILVAIMIVASSFLLLYTYFVVRRFAPFAYAISLISLLFLYISYPFENLITLVLPQGIDVEFLRWVFLIVTTSLITSGSIFGRERSRLAAITYTLSIVYFMLIIAGFITLTAIIPYAAQIRILDWTLTGLLAFFSAGYLGGRYTERGDAPTLYFSLFFYGIGFTALSIIGYEVGYLYLPVIPRIEYLAFFYVMLLISATSLFLAAISIAGYERFSTITLVILSSLSTYLFLNPQLFTLQFAFYEYFTFSFATVFMLVIVLFLMIPLGFFGILFLALLKEPTSVAHIRTVSLLLGTLIYIISLSESFLVAPPYFPTEIPAVLRGVAMFIYALGTTGLLAKWLKIGKRR